MKKQHLIRWILLFPLLAVSSAGGAATKSSAPEATVRMESDQTVYAADTAPNAVIKVAVKAPPIHSPDRPPLNLAIVLDRSGSMSGDKIEHARLAAIEAVRRLGPEDRFALVTYDSEIETVLPSQQVRDIEAIEQKIRTITPRGRTAIYGGVSQGAAEIRKHLDGPYVHQILLLSDGIANVGPSSPADLERLGQAFARENIVVTTIGVGLDYNEDLMTRLARASDGNTYFVEASHDLPRILTAELGNALNVFAREVVLDIEFPEDVRPLAVLGRQGTIDDQTARIPLHQLYNDQERFALIEVELPSRPDDTHITLGRASLHYEDVARQSQATVRSPAAFAYFSSSKAKVASSANEAVQKQALEVRAAEAREEAIALADQGQQQEASEKLRQVSSLYSDAATRFNAPALAAPARALALEADQVEETGIDNRQRKSYRAANHQVINQQKPR